MLEADTVRVEFACPPAGRFTTLLLSELNMPPKEFVERLTGPVKPSMLVSVITAWPVPPCFSERDVGLAVIRKSGPVTFTGM